MPDIKRAHDPDRAPHMHFHRCPNCERNYSCACQAQPDQESLVCRDCESATYNPAVHGGRGEKSEA